MNIDVSDAELVKLIDWHADWLQHVVPPQESVEDYYMERVNRLVELAEEMQKRMGRRRVPD